MSSRRSGSRIDARTYAPSQDLAPYVLTCWTGRWDLRGQAPHVTELLGDPCVHIVVEDSTQHRGGRVVGVWTSRWERRLEERGYVYGLKLRAGAARAFLPGSAHHWTDRIVPLAEAVGPSAEDITERVLASQNDDSAFAALQEWAVAQRTEVGVTNISLAVDLADRVATDREITTVAQLADVAGMGVRALQRWFREHVGASPKWAIRRRRVQDAALRLERDVPSLADLAAELGYADQAHLTRDFKRLVGKTPTEFAAAVWE